MLTSLLHFFKFFKLVTEEGFQRGWGTFLIYFTEVLINLALQKKVDVKDLFTFVSSSTFFLIFKKRSIFLPFSAASSFPICLPE